MSLEEGQRADGSLEALARLRPAFSEKGSVTAGNSSPLNDGATALVLMSAVETRERGMKPLARLVSAAPAGIHPDHIGIGPVPSSLQTLAPANPQPSHPCVPQLN